MKFKERNYVFRLAIANCLIKYIDEINCRDNMDDIDGHLVK